MTARERKEFEFICVWENRPDRDTRKRQGQGHGEIGKERER